jgi:hypothetical protein
VWHRPDTEAPQVSACFAVTYRTNSLGARDVERSRHAERPRVVVLGDSFLEGWGVSEPARLSNRLETATGQEHLNFAMAHFGPYQELLVYQDMARGFDHAAVLASVVPANDFADLDLEFSRNLPGYEYRYRPYLVGEPPALRHVEYREPRARRFLRQRSYAFNALLEVQRIRAEREAAAVARAVAKDTPRHPSRFHDVSEPQIALLAAILERLADAAQGRPVAVLLVPNLNDLQRFAEDGPGRLAAALAPLAARRGLRIVDLRPGMAEATPAWERYFLPCDYHWSAFGNQVAAELALGELGAAFYPELPAARPVTPP